MREICVLEGVIHVIKTSSPGLFNITRLPWRSAFGKNEDGGDVSGIVVFSLDTGEYQTVTASGSFPRWLADGRRVLCLAGAEEDLPVRFALVDTQTGEVREVLSAESLGISPDELWPWPAISPDDRTIYFTRWHLESDIWMLTLGEPE